MGNQSSSNEGVMTMTLGEVVDLVQKCVGTGSGDSHPVADFVDLWKKLDERRATDVHFDDKMVKYNVIRFLKVAFHNNDKDWRIAGINVSRTFFHLPQARKKLLTSDFVGSVLFITMGDGIQEEHQLLAAETFCQMADYKEFEEELCTTSVLNFLCIVLNQLPKAEKTVTSCFAKLARNPDNLVILVEGSVGDILETFFKSVDYSTPQGKKRSPEKMRSIAALAHCASTLGTLIKYGYECQVETRNILLIYREATVTSVSLEAEVGCLFYWICRHSNDRLEEVIAEAGELHEVMECITNVWNNRCQRDHASIKAWDGLTMPSPQSPLGKLCAEENVSTVGELKNLAEHVNKRTCYVNSLLWVCLPAVRLRGLLKTVCDGGATKLYLAFELREEHFLQVVLGTARYLLDCPRAHFCQELMKFFGEQLLVLLDGVLMSGTQKKADGTEEIKPFLSLSMVQLLLDCISIWAMQRDMMLVLAEHNIWDKLRVIIEDKYAGQLRIQLSCLRTVASIAMHPSHRIPYIGSQRDTYPPREELLSFLQETVSNSSANTQPIMMMGTPRCDVDMESIESLGTLLLTALDETRFKPTKKGSIADIEDFLQWLLTWWRQNTSARVEEEKEIAEDGESSDDMNHNNPDRQHGVLDADTILEKVHNESLNLNTKDKRTKNNLSVMEALPYSAPYECIVLLNMLSRVALEPSFKATFTDEGVLKTLLATIATGLWAEAREAASVLGNLLWYGGLREEQLVCWLKFDRIVAADAGNVLLPIKAGNPKLIEIGTGLGSEVEMVGGYLNPDGGTQTGSKTVNTVSESDNIGIESGEEAQGLDWGVEFLADCSVVLHPDGLVTSKVPSILTTASPSDTFVTSKNQFESMMGQEEAEGQNEKHFTVTAWFLWPLSKDDAHPLHVLVQSKKKPLIWCNTGGDGQGLWHFMGIDGNVYDVKPPILGPGWHMFAFISSTNGSGTHAFQGSKIYFDTWHEEKPMKWMKNEFFVVGNDSVNGKCPFGTICDFRIYAKALNHEDIMDIHKRRSKKDPDQLVKLLARLNAVEILSRRLDVPDSSAECLRCLASLATYASLRPLVFACAGEAALELLYSPLNMLQRQAARLIQNVV